MRKKLSKILENLTLFDDIFFTKVVTDNPSIYTEILNSILGKNIQIKSLSTQKVMVSQQGYRTIKLDSFAIDQKDNLYNLEIQNKTKDAPPERIDFHSFLVGARALFPQEVFEQMRNIFIIFLFQKDPLQAGEPVYHVVEKVEETNKIYCGKVNKILINGNYEGKNQIGQLIHDFKCKNPKEIINPVLKEAISFYKEEKEGRIKMCKELDDYIEEVSKVREKKAERKGERKGERKERKRLILANIQKMKNRGKSIEEVLENIMDYFDLNEVQAEKYIKMSMK